MDNTRVDYDRIASTYDRRFAGGGLSGVSTALAALAHEVEPHRTLEVGCGTGHWLAALRSASDFVYGLDLSAGMLGQARQRRGLRRLVRGRAGRLPFASASLDLVYCINAIHHFESPRDFVFEARRLLRPGGALAVGNMDPRHLVNRWYVYEYFPRTYETDLARFPSWGTILDWMTAAGFRHVDWQPVDQIVDAKAGRAVLQDRFLEKSSCSQLALLSDEEYATGLRRIRDAIEAAEAAGEVVTFPVDLFLAMVVGRVR